MPERIDDSQLLDLAVQGDRLALSQLLLRNYGALLGYVTAKMPASLRPVLSSEDLVQEVLLRAIRSIRQFESHDSQVFSAWLQVIAERVIASAVARRMASKRSGKRRRVALPDQARGRSSRKQLVELMLSVGEAPHRAAEQTEAVHAMHVALASLPESQRDAIRIHVLDGKSIQETAGSLHRTPDAVRGLIYRAQRVLREVLQHSSRWMSRK